MVPGRIRLLLAAKEKQSLGAGWRCLAGEARGRGSHSSSAFCSVFASVNALFLSKARSLENGKWDCTSLSSLLKLRGWASVIPKSYSVLPLKITIPIPNYCGVWHRN